MPQLFKSIKLLALAGSFFFVFTAEGQEITSSPYSRFGLGELNSDAFTNNQAMGGWTLGWRDSMNVKLNNPALLADLRRTTFHTGVNGIVVNRTNGSLNQSATNANLANIVLGVPLGKKGGLSFGISPFSSVGYEIENEVDLDSLGMLTEVYQGSGGINQFNLGLGYEVLDGFQVGLNASYNFGSLSRLVTADFDTSTFYDARFVSTTSINDFSYELGALYGIKINDELNLTLSGVYGLEAALSGTQTRLLYSFRQVAGREEIKDTAIFDLEKAGEILIPGRLAFGFGINSTDWGFGAEVQTRNWSSFRSFGETDSLANSTKIRLGGYLTPDPDAVGNYWKAITYRFGAYYNQSYLQLRNTQLNDLGISFGMSLPLRRTFSRVNLAVALGKRGTIDQGLIQENYMRFSVGFTLNDRWFRKRRID